MYIFFLFLGIGFLIYKILGGQTSYIEMDRKGEKVYYNLPWVFPFTNSNAAYIFVQLGVNLLNVDREDSTLKRDFIHRYVRSRYGTTALDFRDHYLTSLRYNHKDDDLAKYLRSKLKTKEKLLTVVHFLCGLAYADGIMMTSERRYIDRFCKELGVSSEDVSEIVNSYFYKQEERNKKEEENNQSSSRNSSKTYQSSYTKESLKKKFTAVLDIPENSDPKKIKTAYRLLAKKWHPDLMANHSETEQKYANEKFREILEAYEYLKKTN